MNTNEKYVLQVDYLQKALELSAYRKSYSRVQDWYWWNDEGIFYLGNPTYFKPIGDNITQ